MKKICILFIFVVWGSLVMVSDLYAQGVYVGPIKFKGQEINFNSRDVAQVVEKMNPTTGKKVLLKKDVESIAKEFGLFKITRTNPQLAYDDGDISTFHQQYTKHKWDEEYLRLQFASRRTVLEAADKQGVIIDTKGDLSALAQQIMADMLRSKKALNSSKK